MRIKLPKGLYQGRFQEVNADVVDEYRTTGGQLASFFVGRRSCCSTTAARAAARRTRRPSPAPATATHT